MISRLLTVVKSNSNPRLKIKGKSKTTFESLSRDAVNELKLGILAYVDGKSDSNDFILASKFTIAPDTDDKFDKAAAEIDKENYEKFAPVWADKAQRKLQFFGKEIPGVGTIVDDNDLQDYVGKVGQKLVPDYLTARNKLILSWSTIPKHRLMSEPMVWRM